MGEIMLNGRPYSAGISYKELTQAEYNALPDSKYTDGIMYCIKDATGGVEGFPPLIYSDEEREVGVWRDGRPLYQKTINFGSMPNSSSKNVAHNISNLEYVVKVYGVVVDGGGDFHPIPDVNKDNASYQIAIEVNSSNIRVITGYNRSAWETSYITLLYTKTTDTPGSGKWTTQGEVAHHYSTTERVIGTWIDGKPLYEKTFNFGALPNNTTKDVNHNIPNIDHIWIVGGFAEASATGFTNQLNLSGTSGGDWYFGVNKTYIRCLANSNRTGYDICYVTVNYTKTTD